MSAVLCYAMIDLQKSRTGSVLPKAMMHDRAIPLTSALGCCTAGDGDADGRDGDGDGAQPLSLIHSRRAMRWLIAALTSGPLNVPWLFALLWENDGSALGTTQGGVTDILCYAMLDLQTNHRGTAVWLASWLAGWVAGWLACIPA